METALLAFGDDGWGDELALGFLITIALAITSYLIGTLIGLGLAVVGIGGNRLLRAVTGGYGVIFRSVPELLVLFLVYFGASIALTNLLKLFGLEITVSLNTFTAGVVALSMVHAAYSAEVFIGALRSVPTGLIEAASALGLSRRVAFFKVTLPVALRFAFPGLMNLWMVMIKNTPLVSAIGLPDLIGQASTAGENTKAYFLFFFVALAIYLCVSALSMVFQENGKRRLFRHLPDAG